METTLFIDAIADTVNQFAKDRRYTQVAEYVDGDIPVYWFRCKSSHVVVYGLQVSRFTLRNKDMEAAKAYGLCVRHSAECAGLLREVA